MKPMLTNLKTSPSELKSSNSGIADFTYTQVNSTVESTNASFYSKPITFRWNLSGTQWWSPKDSYVRIVLNQRFDHASLNNAAPALHIAAGLFTSADLRLNGTIISRCDTKLAQIDTLEYRLHKSLNWLNTFGDTVLGFGSDRTERRVTANEAAGRTICWVPMCLPVFKSVDSGLPCGDYELTLNTQSVNYIAFRTACYIEQNAPPTIASMTDGKYVFNVEAIDFQLATFKSERVENLTYFLDLANTRCQSQLRGAATGLIQQNFDIYPSAYATTVAFQHPSAGTGTYFITDAQTLDAGISGDNDPANGSHVQNFLSRFFTNYAGKSRPSPDLTLRYNATGGTHDSYDTLKQIYINSMFETGSIAADPSEPYGSFLDRGLYIHQVWPRDGGDQSTRFSVYTSFDTPAGFQGGGGTLNCNTLVFDHYYSYVEVTIKNGKVQSVRVQEQ